MRMVLIFLIVTFLVSVPTLSADEKQPPSRPAVEIIAHRGASHDAPENTLTSLRLAWKQQADASEFDVFLTKDGQLAVIHDKDTKRTANGTNLLVTESTFDRLRTLDVGQWKGKDFAGEKIPSLAEMLANVPEGKRVFVEVKSGVEAVPALIRTIKAAKLKAAQTPIISFHAEVIAAVKKAEPELAAYWIVSLNPKKSPPRVEKLLAKAREIRADGLDLQATSVLDDAYAKAVRKAGLKLYVWTVNDLAVAQRMVKLGVEGITTDRPGWLREQLLK